MKSLAQVLVLLPGFDTNYAAVSKAPSNSGLLSCSDGGQFIDMRGSLVFDHCDYSRFDDDGANIFI
ncbi:MAG: hypothetical protein ACLQVW_06870 [Limisphaerales bacterium]